MCEDYPACGHDLNDCPEQSMEDYYGWSLDDWDEPLTPEEQAKADADYFKQQEQEAYAEFLMSPYCFD